VFVFYLFNGAIVWQIFYRFSSSIISKAREADSMLSTPIYLHAERERERKKEGKKERKKEDRTVEHSHVIFSSQRI